MKDFNENEAVGRLAEIIALERGYTPATARQVKTVAALHDVGKQRIPKSILDKPGKLNADEFEIIKTHTKLGAEILTAMQGNLGEMARITSLFHHEWINPSAGGYWGVSALYLPDYVSIVSVADVYLALLSKRVYKEAWSESDALKYIENQAGTQFSRELVNDFISLINHGGCVPAVFTDTHS
jgi:putative two-component system response regulator